MKKNINLLFYIMILIVFLNQGILAKEINTTASSAILMEEDKGQILYQKNIHKKLAPASLTKILTTIVALENCDLNEMVTVSRRAVEQEGSSIYLQLGEKISLENLLYAIMLSSGNDAAVAIAEHVSSSVEEFAELMNLTAKKAGALNSNFTNPSGLPDTAHYSTAYDLAMITRYALNYDKFKEISATKNKIISWEGHDWDRGLHNHHKMLWSYDGVTGGKTGYTRVAGRCLITTASRNNRNLISVLLNCPSEWNDSKKLLDYRFNSFKEKVIIHEKEEVINLKVEDGDKRIIKLLAAKNFGLLFKKDNKVKLKKEIYYNDYIELPVKKGDILALMIIKSGNVEERINLIAESDLDYKSKFKKYWHKFKNKIKEVSIVAKERLQKVMAHAGVASRRKSEDIIKEGRVKVNGQVVRKMGVKVNEKEDIIEVDGELISKEKRVYILLYKPEGYVTTVDDPRGRSTVLDLIDDVKERIYPVGRLDYNTSGLLLLTNDGELTYVLTHPSYEVEKTYDVITEGYISDKKIDNLEKGLRLEDGMTAPAKVKLKERNENHSKFNITIHEGRNRQVRRMCNKIDHQVIKLKRISFHNLDLNGLKKGDYRFLSKKELNMLKKLKN